MIFVPRGPGVWPTCTWVAIAHLVRASVLLCANNFTQAIWPLTLDRSQLSWPALIGFRQKASIFKLFCRVLPTTR